MTEWEEDQFSMLEILSMGQSELVFNLIGEDPEANRSIFLCEGYLEVGVLDVLHNHLNFLSGWYELMLDEPCNEKLKSDSDKPAAENPMELPDSLSNAPAL